MKPEYYQRVRAPAKRQSTRLIKLASSQKQLEQQAIENEIGSFFNDVMNDLQVEHAIHETDYRHEFDDENFGFEESPYMVMKNENDKI